MTATDPATWPRTGWCFKCGPTRRPIAPTEIAELDTCEQHLPRPKRPRQLTLDEQEASR